MELEGARKDEVLLVFGFWVLSNLSILIFFNNRINNSLNNCRHVKLLGRIQKRHGNGGFPDSCTVFNNPMELLV